VECAPGTLSEEKIEALVRCGVNRVSLGVQSFVDQESASVARLHKRAIVLDDIARLRAAGISNINVDLIAGLPHQTVESWQESLEQLIATGVPHASVYMLEVDEDSRLGRELIAGGQKYHAHFVPDEDLTADMYEIACEGLNAAGIQQYEISNFARPGFESKHNLKYWTRQPYLGFGVDAHSMLLADPCSGTAHAGTAALAEPALSERPKEGSRMGPGEQSSPLRSTHNALRFSNPEDLDEYLQCAPAKQTVIPPEAALQETYFLGLRLTRGLSMHDIAAQFGKQSAASTIISDCVRDGLMEQDGDVIRLTPKGRLLSNEVFERFLAPMSVCAAL
ncbi:MAG TPA: coproporphyrinogen-III oxidase family protein, partial [Terriglobales bacterium]|nr:coproporphyrinogen-III oxidase family protein [Terriglobales bacterium]